VNLVVHSHQVLGGNLPKSLLGFLLGRRVAVLADFRLAKRSKLGYDMEQMQECTMVGRDLFGHAERK
jgi:hypothetical protein